MSIFNRKQLGYTIAAAALAVGARTNFAQAQLFVSFDENGSGAAVGGLIPNMQGFMSPDPATGITTLTYNLAGSVGFPATPGDVQITEPNAPAGPTVLSDLLRFDPAGLLYVYSDQEPGETPPGPSSVSADVGLPSNPQADPYNNSILLPETGLPGNPYSEDANGIFNYVPTAGQPGYIPGAFANYNFYSDVPEPASTGLLLAGGSAMLMRRRKRLA